MPDTPHYSDVLRQLAEARHAAAETLTELSRADLPARDQRSALGRTAAALEAAGRTVRTFLAALE
jgi:hypothetical protein